MCKQSSGSGNILVLTLPQGQYMNLNKSQTSQVSYDGPNLI